MQVQHIEKILWESLVLTPSFLPYLWILKQEFIKKVLRVSFYWLSSNLWGCDGYCCMSIWLNSKIFPADKEIFYGTSPRCCSYNDVNCLKECIQGVSFEIFWFETAISKRWLDLDTKFLDQNWFERWQFFVLDFEKKFLLLPKIWLRKKNWTGFPRAFHLA